MSNRPWYVFAGIFGVLVLLFFAHLLVLAGAVNWQFVNSPARARDISEALGLFSALFSGFAAFGLLYTIDLQRRALHVQNQDAKRNTALQLRLLHMELLKLSIHDQDLHNVWSGARRTLSDKESLYVNLILSHWEMMMDNELLDDHQLSLLIEERLHGPMMLFWEKNRDSRRKHAERAGGGHLKFHELVDGRYLALKSAGGTTGPGAAAAP